MAEMVTIFYLNGYEMKVESKRFFENPFAVPLRFFLACVSPAFHQSAVVTLQSIPLEPLADAIRFLDIETIGNLSSTSKWFDEFCSTDHVWEFIYKNVSNYTNARGSDTVPILGSFKSKVHALIKANDRRRMMRFSQSVETSDWAVPMEFLSPTAAVRRRRYNRFDLNNVLL
jgi:hypothetical protein